MFAVFPHARGSNLGYDNEDRLNARQDRNSYSIVCGLAKPAISVFPPVRMDVNNLYRAAEEQQNYEQSDRQSTNSVSRSPHFGAQCHNYLSIYNRLACDP
jgi:hypothetical protein